MPTPAANRTRSNTSGTSPPKQHRRSPRSTRRTMPPRSPQIDIVLSFSRPMRADTMQAAIQLSPDTTFLLRARPGGDGSQFEIIPAAVLQPNQSYTVSVDRPLDTHDNAIFGRVQTRFRTGPLSLSRTIGYLIGQRGQPAFGVGIVDPHPDAFLNRATPKIIYR